MNPIEAANIAVVRKYFDGCQGGDREVLMSTLTGDVVHYFLPSRFPPIKGADHLAKHWCKFKRVLDPLWSIDHLIAQGDEVVSEWSCLWMPAGARERVMMRGSEWYVLRDSRITEIRAYLIDDPAADTGLIGFPYGPRGYLMP